MDSSGFSATVLIRYRLMAGTRTPASTRTPKRSTELKQILEAHRRLLGAEVHQMKRAVRAGGADERGAADAGDLWEGDVRDDLELALMQMKGETLARIDAALRRLDAGSFGDCAECDEPIAASRLRALPFAVRCTTCEGEREERTQLAAKALGRVPPFSF
jgi:DnaK suppressor protein